VPEVARITGPRTVELKSGRVLEDIDTIIYSTGYHSWIPVDFEPQDLNPYAYPGAPPDLYRNVFPLSRDPAIRNSLAFLGQGGIAYPGFSQHEVQGMAVSQIWQGKSSLPPLEEMQQWHQDYLTWREDTTKRYDGKSTFYTYFLPTPDHVDWFDRIAGLGIRKHFGLVERWTNLDAWRFWWQDRRLYYKCLNGLTSPALFRLFDEGKRKTWSGAREQIFIDNASVEKQQKDRLKLLEKQKTV
jgi:dimethylaniline monooxygenase (N-oxide forming)